MHYNLTKEDYAIIVYDRECGGTGDLFWFCTVVKSQIIIKNIDKITFLLYNENSRKIIDLFGLSNIEIKILNSEDKKKVKKIFKARLYSHIIGVGLKEANIYVSNLSSITGNGNFFCGVDMLISNLVQYILDLPVKKIDSLSGTYELLNFPKSKSESIEVIEPKKNRKIILSPNSYSVKIRSIEFWEKLASYFSKEGYTVHTNIGNEKEVVIANTLLLKCTHRELIDLVDECEAFIGIRSGLCDVISFTKVPKIIIYSDKMVKYLYTFGSLCDEFNISEYIVNEENYGEMAQKIIDQIESKHTTT